MLSFYQHPFFSNKNPLVLLKPKRNPGGPNIHRLTPVRFSRFVPGLTRSLLRRCPPPVDVGHVEPTASSSIQFPHKFLPFHSGKCQNRNVDMFFLTLYVPTKDCLKQVICKSALKFSQRPLTVRCQAKTVCWTTPPFSAEFTWTGLEGQLGLNEPEISDVLNH